MSKEPHVVLYPSDTKGCGMYRMFWPGAAIKNSGKPVTIRNRSPEIVVDKSTRKILGINVGDADVVVMQRPGSKQIQEIVPILHEQGKKIIFDMDDSLSLIHPRNPFYKDYDPRVNLNRNWMHIATACRMADHLTVTTKALADEYGKHGRVSIVPNHIPESYLKIQRTFNDIPVVGWAGWTKTHVDDLRVTKGMINKAVVEAKGKFVGFGDTDIFMQLGVRNRYPNENWAFTSVDDYPKRLVGFDIGLVPLQDNPFNLAKSWLKGLEYASLGIVPVVTPIGDYKNLIDIGAAIPASSPKEWYNVVRELILDNDMRLELSTRVRKIASEWTIEGNYEKWWDAWSLV